MDQNFLIIPHYFLGFGALLAGIFAVIIPKKWHLHKIIGRIYLFLYAYIMLSGVLLSVFYDIYSDWRIEVMLLSQTSLAFPLLFRAFFAAKKRVFDPLIKKINFGLTTFSGTIGFFILTYGIITNFGLLTGMGLFVTIITLKDLVEIGLQKPSNYTWFYDHYYGMLLPMAMLPFNGTGFFGVREVYDQFGDVPLSRVLLSFIPLFCVPILCLGLKWMIFRQNWRY